MLNRVRYKPSGNHDQSDHKYYGGNNAGNNKVDRIELVDVFRVAFSFAYTEKTPRYRF